MKMYENVCFGKSDKMAELDYLDDHIKHLITSMNKCFGFTFDINTSTNAETDFKTSNHMLG